jgi:hypothetical protein
VTNDASRFLRRLLDTFERVLRRLFGRDADQPTASPVRHFHVEVTAMKDALFTWTLPTTRQQGGPLKPADIVGTEIALRVVGIPEWTVLGLASGTATEFAQSDLDDGDYEARAVVITDADQRGAAAVLAFSVADDSPAVAVGGFSVELG